MGLGFRLRLEVGFGFPAGRFALLMTALLAVALALALALAVPSTYASLKNAAIASLLIALDGACGAEVLCANSLKTVEFERALLIGTGGAWARSAFPGGP